MASALSRTKHNLSDRFIPLRGETFADASLKDAALSSCNYDNEPCLPSEGFPSASKIAANCVYKNLLFQGLSSLEYASEKPLRMLEYTPLKTKDASTEFKQLGIQEQTLLKTAKIAERLPQRPTQLLDVPGILDDFYCNLVDWSPRNDMAVGLQSSLVLRMKVTDKVSRYAHSSIIHSTSFLNEGSDIAIGSKGGSLALLDIATMNCKWEKPCQSDPIYATTPYMSNAVMIGGENILQFLDLRSKKLDKIEYEGKICRTVFNGQFLIAIGSSENYFALLDVRKASKPLFKPERVHRAAVKALTFFGNRLISGGGLADQILKLWDISKELKEMSQLRIGTAISSAYYSSARNILCVTQGYPGRASIFIYMKPSQYDLKIAPISVVKSENKGRINCAALSPDGTRFMAAGSDEILEVYDLPELIKPRSREPSSRLEKFNAGRLIR